MDVKDEIMLLEVFWTQSFLFARLGTGWGVGGGCTLLQLAC